MLAELRCQGCAKPLVPGPPRCARCARTHARQPWRLLAAVLLAGVACLLVALALVLLVRSQSAALPFVFLLAQVSAAGAAGLREPGA